jgi:hypothetical protein
MNGDFTNIRKSLREIYSIVRKNQFPLDGDLVNSLKADFIAGHEKAMKSLDEAVPYRFTGKMNFLMPKRGFMDNNVQRLLLKSGSEHHLGFAPVAVFVEPA